MEQFVLINEISATYDRNGNLIADSKPKLLGPLFTKIPDDDLTKLHQIPQDKKDN
jgi:hypothetical protein